MPRKRPEGDKPPRKGRRRAGAREAMDSMTSRDEITEEVERGFVQLAERIDRGATLEEALALFPLIGEELSPYLC